MDYESLKKEVYEKYVEIFPDIWGLNQWLYHNPELPRQEHEAVKKLGAFLETHGFTVHYNAAGLNTGFMARFVSGEGGPKIGFLAEYDALPEVGHGCGHNLIAASCLGAAVALAKTLQKPAEIIVMGTPDEEYDGGKIEMAEQDLFSELDLALQLHPSIDTTFAGGSSVPHQTMVISYKGSSAHTAVNPSEGVNALNGVLIAFAGLYSMQQYLKPGTRIPATITHGGGAPNAVPQFAQFRIHITTEDPDYLKEVSGKVENCANAGGLATGAEVNIWKGSPYKKLNSNPVLTKVLAETLEQNGYQLSESPENMAATDVGNVSWECPSTMAYVSLGLEEDAVMHSKEFAAATISEKGEAFLNNAVKVMSELTLKAIYEPALLKKAKEAFLSN